MRSGERAHDLNSGLMTGRRYKLEAHQEGKSSRQGSTMKLWIVLLVAQLGFIQGHPIYETTVPTTTEKVENPRVILLANVGNYSLSFVPLITLLANILPRVVNRFKGVQTTQMVNYRAEGAKEVKADLSQYIDHFRGEIPCEGGLGRRMFPTSPCMYYECRLVEDRPDCGQSPGYPYQLKTPNLNTFLKEVTVVQLDGCLEMRIYKCPTGHVFDGAAQNCYKVQGDLSQICKQNI